MPYKRILVAIDGSKASFTALQKAVELAKTLNAELYGITVVPQVADFLGLPTPSTQGMVDVVLENAKQLRERVLDQVRGMGFKMAEYYVEVGSPSNIILDKAEEIGADLIVVGRRGISGIARVLIGSVSSKIVRAAKRDVLVIESED